MASCWRAVTSSSASTGRHRIVELSAELTDGRIWSIGRGKDARAADDGSSSGSGGRHDRQPAGDAVYEPGGPSVVATLLESKCRIPGRRPNAVARPRLTQLLSGSAGGADGGVRAGRLRQDDPAHRVAGRPSRPSAPRSRGCRWTTATTTPRCSGRTSSPRCRAAVADVGDAARCGCWRRPRRRRRRRSPRCSTTSTDCRRDLVLVLDDYHLIEAPEVHDGDDVPARAPAAAAARRARHPGRPAAAAGADARPRSAGRGAGGRPALHRRGGRGVPQRPDGPRAERGRRRGARRAHRRLDRRPAAGRAVDAGPRRRQRVHRRVRRRRPLHRGLPRRGGPRPPARRRPGLPARRRRSSSGSPARCATPSPGRRRRQGDAGRARAGQPVPRPARRPAAVVPLPPPVRRRPARPPARRAARPRWPSCTGGPAPGSRPTATASQAISHALAGGDCGRAADLMELAMPAMRRERREAELARWVRALPDDVVRVRPVLGVALRRRAGPGVGLRHRRRAAVGHRTLAARGGRHLAGAATAGPDRRRRGRLPVASRPHRRCTGPRWRSRTADLDGTVTHAREALSLAPPDDDLTRAAAGALAGLASWTTGDLAGAHAAYTADRRRAGAASGSLADVLGCCITLGDIRRTQGRLGDAVRTYQRALDLAPPTPPGAEPLRGTADMHVGIAGRAARARRPRGRRRAPGRQPAARRAQRPAAEPVPVAGRHGPAAREPKATSTPRSSCSTRPTASTPATTPRTCGRFPRCEHGCGSGAASSTDAEAWARERQLSAGRRAVVPARVRAPHPGAAPARPAPRRAGQPRARRGARPARAAAGGRRGRRAGRQRHRGPRPAGARAPGPGGCAGRTRRAAARGDARAAGGLRAPVRRRGAADGGPAEGAARSETQPRSGYVRRLLAATTQDRAPASASRRLWSSR